MTYNPRSYPDRFFATRAMTSLDVSDNSIGEQVWVNGWKPYDGEHFKYIRDTNDGTESNYDFSNELPEGCGPIGAIAIATAIKNNGALTSLNMAENNIATEAREALGQALAKSSVLKRYLT
jgi:pantoate kinase